MIICTRPLGTTLIHPTIPIGATMLSVALFISGCGVFFGNQKVDRKSNEYIVLRLDFEKNSPWRAIKDTKVPNNDGFPDEQIDLALQHSQSKAIISINSVCGVPGTPSMDQLVKNLLLGLKEEGDLESVRTLTVDQADAREVILEKSANPVISDSKVGFKNANSTQNATIIQATVLHKAGCSFDLMFISNGTKWFEENRSDYERFVKGFHIE